LVPNDIKGKASQPSIAVIIPTLNERPNLRRLLAELAALNKPPDEIVVVDANSIDGTPDVARDSQVRLIAAQRGRGQQILQGVAASNSDIALILHADMRFESEIIAKISQAMAQHSAPGGAVGNRFMSLSKAMKLIQWMNHCRARFFGVSFGDQGQFFWIKQALEQNWIQPYPIMEDVELSLRMKKAGKPLYLHGGIRSSTRRWDQKNKFFNLVHLVSFLIRYRCTREKRKPIVVKKIYSAYYKENLPDTL
jgi:glycosyltransferase involved in cell wall biosynthesis